MEPGSEVYQEHGEATQRPGGAGGGAGRRWEREAEAGQGQRLEFNMVDPTVAAVQGVSAQFVPAGARHSGRGTSRL